MVPLDIKELAINRRAIRWKKEQIAEEENDAHKRLMAGLAAWKKVSPSQIKLSNIYCRKAPADLCCVFVDGDDPFRNKCLFCGAAERDIF